MEHTAITKLNIFVGPGEMRALCREFDWAATPLGPVEDWSPALRTAAQMVLASGLPNIVLWGPELIQLYNDAYAEIIQAKHPAALGHGNREIWPEVWHLNGPIYERVFAGETVTLEDALYPLRRHGEVEDVYLTVAFSPVRDGTGRVAGVLANMIETTDQVELRRLQAERERLLRALQVEQSRLEYVFQQAPTYLAVLRGPEHVFTLANEAYYQLIGRRDIVGRPIAEALPEAVEQGFVQLLDGVVATGEPFVGREVPVVLQRTPGRPREERFLDFIYQPLVEADGTRTGVVAHGSDVTEQVLARREVERARDRVARLQELTSALATTVAPAEVAEVVVAQAVSIMGAATGLLALRAAERPDEGVLLRQTGLPASVLAENARFSLSMPGPVAECIRTGEPVFAPSREELLARFPEIVETWAILGTQAVATIPLEAAGETVGAMSFTFTAPRAFPAEDRDFFLALGRQCAQALERSRLFAAEHEARLGAERARAEAEAANRIKSQFLATMSHELRTPLNAIGGYAELLAMGIRGPVTSQQAEDLERILRSQRHLLGLINEVLNYAKLETGSVRYDIARVDVAGALSAVEALILPQVRAKALALDIACEAPVAVRADADKLRQILLNLVSNAVKFTDRGGRITLASRVPDAAGATVEITVSDTGEGIAADKLEVIFEPFVQVGRTLASAAEGTGLGLAISRDLARAMEGDLAAASTPGAGSTFILTLPRAAD